MHAPMGHSLGPLDGPHFPVIVVQVADMHASTFDGSNERHMRAVDLETGATLTIRVTFASCIPYLFRVSLIFRRVSTDRGISSTT